MQSLAVNGFTATQITSLLRDSNAVTCAAGVELLDIDLNVLDDLTDYLVATGSSVGRSNYATLHGTAKLGLSQELDWGTAILRPYYSMTDGVVSTGNIHLGAYLTSSPTTDVGESPVTHEIDGYDILHWLNTPVGESYVVAAGTDYLVAVESVLTTQGITQYMIDQQAAGTLLPASRVWAFSDSTTWLNIINDLCAAIGYLGIYSDWDGRLRVEPYLLPADRPAEWLYDSTQAVSMLAMKRTLTRDTFNAPNRWVFYWQQTPEGVSPVEGAGIYTFDNLTNGPTSQIARGRVISAAPKSINVVDQASLVAAAQISIDADLRLATTFDVQSFPNPFHWHFDRMVINDPGVAATADALGVSWSLPLDGGDMTHQMSFL